MLKNKINYCKTQITENLGINENIKKDFIWKICKDALKVSNS